MAAAEGQVAQVRARFVHIQARNTRSWGANLGFIIFRRRQPQIVLPPSGPHSLRLALLYAFCKGRDAEF